MHLRGAGNRQVPFSVLPPLQPTQNALGGAGEIGIGELLPVIRIPYEGAVALDNLAEPDLIGEPQGVHGPFSQGPPVDGHHPGQAQSRGIEELPGEPLRLGHQTFKKVNERLPLFNMVGLQIVQIGCLGVQIVVVVPLPGRQIPVVRSPHPLQGHGRRPLAGRGTQEIVGLNPHSLQGRIGNLQARCIPEIGPPAPMTRKQIVPADTMKSFDVLS